jgi:hypothetical protein
MVPFSSILGLAAAALLATGTASWAAVEATGYVGFAGWELERFGTDVTILRTRQASGDHANAVGLLMSCVQSERRLRITLPITMMSRNRMTGGQLLMRIRGRTKAALIITSFAAGGEGILTLTDQAAFGAVLAALGTKEPMVRVDLLLHEQSAPFVLGRLASFHMVLSSERLDTTVFSDFAAACPPLHSGSNATQQ